MSEYSFTKLFSSIIKSSVWCEPHPTVRVWITMMADCDPNGSVYAAIPGLANLARVTVAECEAAISTFLSPDPYSRTPDNEGRRIEVIEGGWRLLNYQIYRDKRDDGARRAQNREAQQRHRTRQQVSAEMLTKNDKSQESAQVRSQKSDNRKDQEQKQERVRSPKGSRLPADWQPSEEDMQFALKKRPGLNVKEEADKFRDYWHDVAGAKGCKVGWAATWRNWVRRADVSNQPGTGKPLRESLSEQSARLNQVHDMQEGQRHERTLAG